MPLNLCFCFVKQLFAVFMGDFLIQKPKIICCFAFHHKRLKFWDQSQLLTCDMKCMLLWIDNSQKQVCS